MSPLSKSICLLFCSALVHHNPHESDCNHIPYPPSNGGPFSNICSHCADSYVHSILSSILRVCRPTCTSSDRSDCSPYYHPLHCSQQKNNDPSSNNGSQHQLLTRSIALGVSRHTLLSTQHFQAAPWRRSLTQSHQRPQKILGQAQDHNRSISWGVAVSVRSMAARPLNRDGIFL